MEEVIIFSRAAVVLGFGVFVLSTAIYAGPPDNAVLGIAIGTALSGFGAGYELAWREQEKRKAKKELWRGAPLCE